jgi:hypothetical protein
MTAIDAMPAVRQAAVLREIAEHKHPKLALPNTASRLEVTLVDLQAFLTRHGYPDAAKMRRAADTLDDTPAAPEAARKPAPTGPSTSISTAPSTASAGGQTMTLTTPDHLLALINTAKGHPSKRIQAVGNKLLDDIDKLKRLIREDEEKHAERRRLAGEKAAAKAEVQRLEKELRDARAKARTTAAAGTPSRAVTADVLQRHGITAKDIRAWAAENGVDCPGIGVLPSRVAKAYDEAHQDQAAAS